MPAAIRRGGIVSDLGNSAPFLEGWARYAIYAVPAAGSRLNGLGAEWLGRSAETGAPVARSSFDALEMSKSEMDAVTADPARYGFHGTLKAPFRLAEGRSAADLDAALDAYVATRAPVFCPPLKVSVDHGFVALRCAEAAPALSKRAFEIVKEFDRFRAPMTDADRARRGVESLDARGRELLEAWGYPWVDERFDFHFTLSGKLPEDEGAALSAKLEPIFAPLIAEPFVLEEIALFGDPGSTDGRAGPFTLLRRHRFSGV